MPQENDGVLEPGTDADSDTGDEEMAAEHPKYSEAGTLGVVHSALAGGFGAAANRRVDSADQLATNANYMWTGYLASPSVNAGLGFRTATEAGSGQTRREVNKVREE